MQNLLSFSSLEAEYVASLESVEIVVWLWQNLNQLSFKRLETNIARQRWCKELCIRISCRRLLTDQNHNVLISIHKAQIWKWRKKDWNGARQKRWHMVLLQTPWNKAYQSRNAHLSLSGMQLLNKAKRVGIVWHQFKSLKSEWEPLLHQNIPVRGCVVLSSTMQKIVWRVYDLVQIATLHVWDEESNQPASIWNQLLSLFWQPNCRSLQ